MANSAYIKSKIEALFAALSRFDEAMAATLDNTDLLRDARIQRFEFCYDLAWKTSKAVLEGLGVPGVKNPNACFKKAMVQGYIPLTEEKEWLQMIDHRNMAAHGYDQEASNVIAAQLPRYAVLMRALADRLYYVYLEEIPKP